MSPKEDTIETKEVDQPIVPSTPVSISIENIIGAITLLAIKSPNHKYSFVNDLEWMYLPAINLKQFRIFRQKEQNSPLAVVTWASVDEETEQRLLSGSLKLMPKDWNSGDRLWLIDVLSPFVKSINILNQLNDLEFKGKSIKLLRPKKDGKGFEGRDLGEFLAEAKIESEKNTNQNKND